MSLEFQSQFSAFTKLLQTFYSKISKNHPSYVKNNNYLNQILGKISGGAPNKNIENWFSQKNVGLYSSEHFGDVLAFAYLYFIIDGYDYDIIRILESNIKIQGKMEQHTSSKEKEIWDQNMVEWAKIVQAINSKDTIKWKRILLTAFPKLSGKFIQLITRSILGFAYNSKSQIKPTYQWLKKASTQLKISFIFFQFQESSTKNKKLIGEYLRTILFGVKKKNQDSVYYFYEKMPEDKELIELKEKQLQKLEKYGIQNERKQLSIKQKINLIKNQQNSQKSLKSLSEVKSAHNLQRLQHLSSTPSIISDTKKSLNPRLVSKKTLITIQFLLKEFHLNSGKFENLECFDTEYQMRRSPVNEKKRLLSQKSLKFS